MDGVRCSLIYTAVRGRSMQIHIKIHPPNRPPGRSGSDWQKGGGKGGGQRKRFTIDVGARRAASSSPLCFGRNPLPSSEGDAYNTRTTCKLFAPKIITPWLLRQQADKNRTGKKLFTARSSEQQHTGTFKRGRGLYLLLRVQVRSRRGESELGATRRRGNCRIFHGRQGKRHIRRA